MNKYLLIITIMWGCLAGYYIIENIKLRDINRELKFECVKEFWHDGE